MYELINKISNKRVRVMLKDYFFPHVVADEMLDKVESDIIDIEMERAQPWRAYTIMDDSAGRLAVKRAVREKLIRKSQPPLFLTSFVYPFLVSLVTAVVVSKWLN